ncbi:uncharacterized protein LOC108153630 [Drosophila miranda]|uniref:uncharacterized protein LOC108153630 n=1 Tax=Drosophila miranda TaxID=7229 RepID=UPI0007E843BD|nr:uncharacterized protein LOC108153630 [Drosophila miranda]
MSENENSQQPPLPEQPPSRKKNIKCVQELFVDEVHYKLSWGKFSRIATMGALADRINQLPAPIGTLSVLKCCQYLWEMSRRLGTDELATLQKLACILFLLRDKDAPSMNCRMALMRQSFNVVNSLEPMLVHYFSKLFLDYFSGSSSSSRCHVLRIARFISVQSGIGRAVSVCLLWHLIFSYAETPIGIHQYRELGELRILNNVPIAELSNSSFRCIIRAVGTLLHLQLCCPDLNEFLYHGYPRIFFRILPQDVKMLCSWLLNAVTTIDCHRPRTDALKLQTMLDYLNVPVLSRQWCLACRGASGDVIGPPRTGDECVLSQMRS